MSVGEILERDEDRAAYVRFERIAVKDNEASLKDGFYKSKDQDMIYVTPPYSKDEYTSKVDVFFQKKEGDVRSGRIPQKHLELWKEAYAHWRKGQEPPLDGTDVRNWAVISPAQAKNMISAGCRTIEDLAQANDEALRRLGMGGNDLKNKAKAWLQAAKDHGPLTEEISQLKNQNKQLQGTIDSLQEQIKRFEIRMDAQDGEYKPMEHSAQSLSWEKTEIPAPEAGVIRETVHTNPEITASQYKDMSAETILKSEAVAKKHVSRMLRDEYEKKFGRKPAGRMKDETMRQKLNEG